MSESESTLLMGSARVGNVRRSRKTRALAVFGGLAMLLVPACSDGKGSNTLATTTSVSAEPLPPSSTTAATDAAPQVTTPTTGVESVSDSRCTPHEISPGSRFNAARRDILSAELGLINALENGTADLTALSTIGTFRRIASDAWFDPMATEALVKAKKRAEDGHPLQSVDDLLAIGVEIPLPCGGNRADEELARLQADRYLDLLGFIGDKVTDQAEDAASDAVRSAGAALVDLVGQFKRNITDPSPDFGAGE